MEEQVLRPTHCCPPSTDCPPSIGCHLYLMSSSRTASMHVSEDVLRYSGGFFPSLLLAGPRLVFVFGGACWCTLMPLMQFLRIVFHRGSRSFGSFGIFGSCWRLFSGLSTVKLTNKCIFPKAVHLALPPPLNSPSCNRADDKSITGRSPHRKPTGGEETSHRPELAATWFHARQVWFHAKLTLTIEATAEHFLAASRLPLDDAD